MIFLALDRTNIDGHDLPTGRIVGINKSRTDLRAAGFDGRTYRGQRLVQLNLSSSNWDDDCTIGWYYQGGKVVQSLAPTSIEQVQSDINRFKQIVFNKENDELPKLLAREKIDTAMDGGHTWVDDVINAWIKPWLRLIESKLATEKASDSPDPTNYSADLDAFMEQCEVPGILHFHSLADRSVWRPLRDGTTAWEFDSDSNGTKTGTDRAVSYPASLTVQTWEAYKAIKEL